MKRAFPILELNNLTYSYDKKKKILRGVNAQMETGEMYAILGSSGCGKTTLLSLIGGLDSPTSGSINFNGKDISQIGLENHRKKNIVFIFQSYNLIDYMTPQENVWLTAKKPVLSLLESSHDSLPVRLEMALLAEPFQLLRVQRDLGVVDIPRCEEGRVVELFPRRLPAVLAHPAVHQASLGDVGRPACLPGVRIVERFCEGFHFQTSSPVVSQGKPNTFWRQVA